MSVKTTSKRKKIKKIEILSPMLAGGLCEVDFIGNRYEEISACLLVFILN